MDKKKYIWIIIVAIIGVIYGIIDSENKIILPIVLVSILVVIFIIVLIYIIICKTREKRYGPEERVKIISVLLKEENMNQYAQILSNGKTENCDENTLIENYTVRISLKTKTEELLKSVNELLNKLGYDLFISEDEIYKRDYEFIKIRRANDYSTLRHDLNVIINILNNFNLEAINIEKNNNGDIHMSIVSFDKLEEIDRLGEYDENFEK